MSSRSRVAIVVLGLIVLVIGFVIASGSDDTSKKQDRTDAGAVTATETAPVAPETTTTPAPPKPAPPVTTPTVTVVKGKPQGGVKRLTFTKGDTMSFTVESDTTDEIHVHGYDVHADVKAGESATLSIAALIEGRFVVELEGHGTQIAELEVDPK